MVTVRPLNVELALFLAICCKKTYVQFKNDGIFTVPDGFRLVTPIKAQTGNTPEWFGFVMESDSEVVLAFRGTQTDPDWIADADVGQERFPFTNGAGLTHSGFTSIYKTCREQIFRAFRSVSPFKKLYITGHSLGGALSVLAILDIVSNAHFDFPVMMNFGAPRTGNPRFTTVYDWLVDRSFRVVNTHDIVPMLPPKKIRSLTSDKTWYYSHLKGDHRISIQTGSIRGNHSINTYIKALKHLKETRRL
ncbi:lipase family protein [Pseudalkalibacillus caeni]|uniref:Lipase family protein n=1 Tax=Exobacillus caeni TaxID=2574798 RepID=A0A5R9F553_9BACL|nr:lipase family protein [Pseudalkalibacillus caeni]TLS37530.1 lipase family protein [Pseudalkalibacillus caeni]